MRNIRFSFHQYGARGHRAGFGHRDESDGVNFARVHVEQKPIDDPQRSAHIDKVLARLRGDVTTSQHEHDDRRRAA